MNLRATATFHAALADEARLKILAHLLGKGCRCICELAPVLKKDQSVVYRHVKQLEAAGLVRTKKEGKYLRCCLADEARVKGVLQET